MVGRVRDDGGGHAGRVHGDGRRSATARTRRAVALDGAVAMALDQAVEVIVALVIRFTPIT
jgi:hypothetical protein